MTDERKSDSMSDDVLVRRIRDACANSFGVLESKFLCQSVSVLEPKSPLVVQEQDSIEQAIRLLQKHRSGCVVVIDGAGAVSGIFTERDCLLKVALGPADLKVATIESIMTRDPICERADATIAYALNLMSVGGFRHIPIVDDRKHPIGMISVKDVVDYIVQRLTEDLLAFETEK